MRKEDEDEEEGGNEERTQPQPEQEVVCIKRVKGKRLGKRDLFGGCNPYCRMRLMSPQGDVLRECLLDTQRKNRNPEWRIDWKITVNGDEHINISLYNENRIRRDAELGCVVVSVESVRTHGRNPIELPLPHRGSLVLYASSEDEDEGSGERNGILPNGWEEREDTNGRTFYVDHMTHRTQWDRPDEGNEEREEENERETIERRRYYDERARAVEETVGNGRDVSEEVEAVNDAMRMNYNGEGRDEEVEEDPLPDGWAMQIAPNGRTFFIDHVNRRTTWDDPRLSSVRLPSRPLPSGWEERMSSDGKVFFVDHNNKRTTWEDPRFSSDPNVTTPFSTDFKRKVDFFRSKLPRPPTQQGKCELVVHRENILEDSFTQVMAKAPEDLRNKLWIELLGERALDYGGVSREWCFLLSRHIFNPYYGLFEYSAMDKYTLQVNPHSETANPDHLKYLQFIGRVIGMALYHGKLLDAFFIRPFYKQILGQKVVLEDMEAVDVSFYNSLMFLRDNDPSDLQLVFAVDDEAFGEKNCVELKKDGKEIPVTQTNKNEYIEAVIEWRFAKRIEKQMESLLLGIFEVVPSHLLRVFDAPQLELLMCGLQAIDVADWRANTLYKGGYTPNHVVVHHFWQCVLSFNNETRARLVQFVTGTSRVPMNGFRELFGSNGPQLFTIELWGTEDMLPRAHTCFNRIDLPPYSSFGLLRRKLIQAIDNSEYFAGVD